MARFVVCRERIAEAGDTLQARLRGRVWVTATTDDLSAQLVDALVARDVRAEQIDLVSLPPVPDDLGTVIVVAAPGQSAADADLHLRIPRASAR